MALQREECISEMMDCTWVQEPVIAQTLKQRIGHLEKVVEELQSRTGHQSKSLEIDCDDKIRNMLKKKKSIECAILQILYLQQSIIAQQNRLIARMDRGIQEANNKKVALVISSDVFSSTYNMTNKQNANSSVQQIYLSIPSIHSTQST